MYFFYSINKDNKKTKEKKEFKNLKSQVLEQRCNNTQKRKQ